MLDSPNEIKRFSHEFLLRLLHYEKLLAVENISTTPHLTKECKRVIVEQAIESFDVFFPQIEQKNIVIVFVKKYVNSPRKTLQTASERFLKKWDQSM